MKERTILIIPILVFCIVLLKVLRPETNEINTSIMKRFWIVKTHTEKKFNLLVCGDSRTYRGVSPDVIEEVLTDFSVLNFGYSSGSFSAFMLEQIEKKLDVNASIKVLYLGITPYSLTPKAAKDGHIKEELGRKKEEIIEALYFDPVKRFFEPYTISWDKKRDSVAYIQEYNTDGWVATDKIPPNPKEALPIYVKDFENNSVSDEIIQHLMLKVKAWSLIGVKVFATRPPTTKEMVELENRLSGFREEEFRKQFAAAGGIWLEIDNKRYKSFDGSHLDISSSISFSGDIAVSMKLHLNKRR
jgi:hypothetical protein